MFIDSISMSSKERNMSDWPESSEEIDPYNKRNVEKQSNEEASSWQAIKLLINWLPSDAGGRRRCDEHRVNRVQLLRQRLTRRQPLI